MAHSVGEGSYHLYHIAARGHTQLRKEIAYQVYIIIVYPVESLGVNFVDNYYSFVHFKSISK